MAETSQSQENEATQKDPNVRYLSAQERFEKLK